MSATAFGYRCARWFAANVLVSLFIRGGPLEPPARRAYRAAGRRIAGTRRLPNPVESRGFLLRHDGRPSFTVRGLHAGGYEQPTFDLIEDTLRPAALVIDVGAHIGAVALFAAAHTHGPVWAFEPDPTNARLLRENAELNGLGAFVTVVEAAVGDSEREVTLYRDPSDSGSASTHRRIGASASGLMVQGTTLDSRAGAAGWPAVQLVKIDAEGSEPAVLRGMAELCARNPALVIVVELNREALEAAGESPASLIATLHALGFDHVRPIGRSPTAALESLAARSAWIPVNLLCSRRARELAGDTPVR